LTGRIRSQYRVAGRIGAGVVGQVYRLHDTRLDRTIAIMRHRPLDSFHGGPYWITWFARLITSGGMVTPISRAVFRFTVSS